MSDMKQIFAVSLDSPRKHRAAATLFDNTQLVITHCLSIDGPPSAWRDVLRTEIEEKAKAGYAVIIEDRTGRFSPYASAFSFEDVEQDRTMLQHSLDWWFSLENSGNLVLDDSVRRFSIRAGEEGGMIDIKHDDKGRVIYHPNWTQFNGGHKAMLLCVAAAMLENPASERWLKAMFACLPQSPNSPLSIHERWGASLDGLQAGKEKRFAEIQARRQAALENRRTGL